jgi:hypothetical protein
MARTKGALGKPKFANVKLSDLCQFLKSDTYIPIDVRFAQALNTANSGIKIDEIVDNQTKTNPIEDEKIEFVIIDKK